MAYPSEGSLDRWKSRQELSGATVIASEYDCDPDAGRPMEFRLTYEGKLLRSGSDKPRAQHKHELRKAFHKQLRRLWGINPYLKHGNPVTFDWEQSGLPKNGTTHGTTLAEWLANQYQRCGYQFVPLVRRELSLVCALSILFLRPDQPGDVLSSGDIDGRLKTLFDALTMPQNAGQLGPYKSPGEDETPFFCLLADDSLITHVAVETDVLLEPIGTDFDKNDARLVVSVKLRPYIVDPSNENFG